MADPTVDPGKSSGKRRERTAYFAAYYQANREKKVARQRARYRGRAEELRDEERARRWRKKGINQPPPRRPLQTEEERRASQLAAIKRWNKRNPDKVREGFRRRYAKRKTEIAAKARARRLENLEKARAIARLRLKKNGEKMRAWERAYRSRRRANDINFHLSMALRVRLATALRRNIKHGSAVRDLGCSLDEFRAYIAAQFTPGMSWENWGRSGWHLDHRQALASFDLSDPDQFKQAVHYSNYQPLWASDNCSKGAKPAPIQTNL